MLKAAIEKILSLDAPHIEEIEGRTYVDKDMTQIGKELRATSITMSNLSSLVDFIKKSKADFKTGHYIAQVVSPTEVRLFSSLDADRQRETLAVVKAEIPEFSFGQFIGNEEFVIGVQSKFLNEDAEANDKPIILQFAGNVKAGTVAEYGDTGVGQKAANSSKYPSTVLCEQIDTVNKDKVGDYIGQCSMAEMKKIDAALAVSIGIGINIKSNDLVKKWAEAANEAVKKERLTTTMRQTLSQ